LSSSNSATVFEKKTPESQQVFVSSLLFDTEEQKLIATLTSNGVDELLAHVETREKKERKTIKNFLTTKRFRERHARKRCCQ